MKTILFSNVEVMQNRLRKHKLQMKCGNLWFPKRFGIVSEWKSVVDSNVYGIFY
jgi:hypothetical protein